MGQACHCQVNVRRVNCQVVRLRAILLYAGGVEKTSDLPIYKQDGLLALFPDRVQLLLKALDLLPYLLTDQLVELTQHLLRHIRGFRCCFLGLLILGFQLFQKLEQVLLLQNLVQIFLQLLGLLRALLSTGLLDELIKQVNSESLLSFGGGLFALFR